MTKQALIELLEKMEAKGNMLHDMDRVWLRTTGLRLILKVLKNE